MAVKGDYKDIAFDFVGICGALGFNLIRRFQVPVGSHQVGPQVRGSCKEERFL